jgi:hypothetical protein
LFLDSTYAIDATAVDRRGNTIVGSAPWLNSSSSNVAIDQARMTVTPLSLGTVALVWLSGSAFTTVERTVVPRASLAYATLAAFPIGARLIIYAANLDGSKRREVYSRAFYGSSAGGLRPTWSLNRSRIAHVDSAGAIIVDDLNGSRRAVAAGVAPGTLLSWTADEHWLYYTRDGTETWRARTDGSATDFVVSGRGTVSPDGSLLALYDGGLWLYTIASGAKTWVSQTGLPEWSHDGRFILAANENGGVARFHADGTLDRVLGLPGTAGVGRLSSSPNGDLFLAELGGGIWLGDFENSTWQPLSHLAGGTDPDWGSAMLP